MIQSEELTVYRSMSIDVDIVPDRRNIGIDRSLRRKSPFPTDRVEESWSEGGEVYRDEQSRMDRRRCGKSR